MKSSDFITALHAPETDFNNSSNACKLIEQSEIFADKAEKISNDDWFEFLNRTRKQAFLEAAGSEEYRLRLTEVFFKILQHTDYGLADMLEHRVAEHPDRIFLQEISGSKQIKWSYSQSKHYIRQTAALLYKLQEKPRVALYTANSLDGAVADLACLSYGIFNSPLNIHFSTEILAYIFKKLQINIVICDTPERLKTVSEALESAKMKAKIIVSQSNSAQSKLADYYLPRKAKQISQNEADKILSERPRFPLKRVATTMFTSGSTGMPKGVSFSYYNIVSKRFARACALPETGKSELFICYLPLFHTFGRYLELIGLLFWGGTYVFAGNPSAARLQSLFPRLNPTGFISVPVRWAQLYERCIKETEQSESEQEKEKVIRTIIGKRLHWGLSAAGYLDPKVFRFFHRYGVKLNSGFGMTEATGGITMTPPGEYAENSVGKALPGMQTRLKENGELEIRSHYLAKYLEDAPPEAEIPYPHQEEYWLQTGDIFKISKDGHHEIIDRVKDIYKNNKGQTVAPGIVEQKFTGVPGIKRSFLVGDGRPYNVLLIVPDSEDPVFSSSGREFKTEEYFHQIVMSANKDLAPYERVINFTVLQRDFSADKDELTPKGSFKRKNIEKNFSELIGDLYRSNHVYIKQKDFTIKIPRWFYRDIGILESDIIWNKNGLLNKQSKKSLALRPHKSENSFVVGDLAYELIGNEIDLGRMVRQPKLWLGNPQLVEFSSCKESFELPLKKFTRRVFLPEKRKIYAAHELTVQKNIPSGDMLFLHNLISTILHTGSDTALQSLMQTEQIFSNYETDKAEIIRRRLEAVAAHPDDELRINAYRILISADPEADFSQVLPAFINSGKPFLNEKSVKKIARSGFGRKQLDALRKRMYAYRTGLQWPADNKTRKQFYNIFKLLLNFGIENPEYYGAIRAEFACWMLLKEDTELAKKAKGFFDKLYKGFVKYIKESTPEYSAEEWNKRTVFDEGITEADSLEIIKKMSNSHFLKQSIITIYDGEEFDLSNVKERGIWVSRVRSYRATKHYRLSISTKQGRHFDVHIVLDKKINSPQGLETLYRSIALSGHVFGNSAIAEFGCSSPKNGIVSTRYLSELSAWEKIRAVAELQTAGYIEEYNIWRKIFIRSMSTFYRAWENSCQMILPGFVSPNNVVLPENDFSENTKLMSLSGWQKSDKVYPLIMAMYRNFYKKTEAHYPALKKYLNRRWLFHACVETFGDQNAPKILQQAKTEFEAKTKKNKNEKEISERLHEYLENFNSSIYLPLALFNAIDRYNHWRSKNKRARSKAKAQTISEMIELYKLGKYPDIVRYKFYRETYFSDSDKNIKSLFDKLLEKMLSDTDLVPVQLIELSDLQSAITERTDQAVFSKMVFPNIKEEQKIDLIISQTHQSEEQVIVRTIITDKNEVEYTMREPANPSEVGEVYRLFYKENYPKEISKLDKHFVVTDLNEQVVAALCYKTLENKIVLLDGMAVSSPLHNRGIGSSMMSDFFSRMKSEGIKLIKAHFLFGNYYLKHNFVVDNKWGALVKEL